MASLEEVRYIWDACLFFPSMGFSGSAFVCPNSKTTASTSSTDERTAIIGFLLFFQIFFISVSSVIFVFLLSDASSDKRN